MALRRLLRRLLLGRGRAQRDEAGQGRGEAQREALEDCSGHWPYP
jgi:hypothetical protein